MFFFSFEAFFWPTTPERLSLKNTVRVKTLRCWEILTICVFMSQKCSVTFDSHSQAHCCDQSNLWRISFQQYCDQKAFLSKRLRWGYFLASNPVTFLWKCWMALPATTSSSNSSSGSSSARPCRRTLRSAISWWDDHAVSRSGLWHIAKHFERADNLIQFYSHCEGTAAAWGRKGKILTLPNQSG